MRIIAWFTGLPLAVVIVVFALSNRGPLDLGLWPLNETLIVPTYLAVLAPLVVGVLMGWVLAGTGRMRRRKADRAGKRRIEQLEQQVAILEGRQTEAMTPVVGPAPGTAAKP